MTTWWAARWHSKNNLDGETRHIMYERGLPIVFGTRQEARDWIRERYGYIRHRKDLRREPHGWRLPSPVRIKVITRIERA